MIEHWRIPAEKPEVAPPDWVIPFLELDREWQAGKAQGQTSGSTGTPQQLDFTPSAVRSSARATAQHFGLASAAGAGVATWSALPAAGIGGRMMWWRARILNWQLTQSRPAAAPVVPPLPASDRYDFAVATPQQAAHLFGTDALRHFRILLLGGGPIPRGLETELVEAGKAANCAIHVGFGMTETLTHIATRRLGQDAYRPLPGVEWKQGESGAMILDIPSRGIIGLQTKDIAEPAKDGAKGPLGFRWLGRLDDVINTGGLKVHPAPLEEQLASLIVPRVDGRRWYLAGRPHPQTGQQVTLVIEGAADAALGSALLNQLAVAHPQPDRPRAIEWMSTFEETATGKIRRI